MKRWDLNILTKTKPELLPSSKERSILYGTFSLLTQRPIPFRCFRHDNWQSIHLTRMIQSTWSVLVYKESPDGENRQEHKGKLYNRPAHKSATHS